MTPLPGTLVARRFQLVRELGRGSMGTVWLADHKTLGLRCAVKFTTPGAERDPDYLARFEREARAVAQLDCPNVVRVLDYDVFEGVPFLAMEWLPGEDLETRLLRERHLGAREVHRIVTQIAAGLTRAHAAGIVHRDLKPGNIFLTHGVDGEVAKILDFGLAKLVSFDADTTMTQAGSILGTPVYMSPEQARGVSDVDPRADLWSLAVITYECLLGKLPFDGPSLGEVFARVMFEPIPVPSAIDPDLPPAFDRWWERAACRDVEGRFASAREMADALGQALGLDDGHSSKADLASVQSVRPPSRPRSSRWLAAIAAASVVFAGVQVLPRVPRLPVPTGIGDPMRSAMRAIAHSVSRLGARAEAAMPAEPPVPAASPGALAPSSAAQPPDPTARPVDTPLTLPGATSISASVPPASVTMPSSSPSPHKIPTPIATTPSADEPPTDETAGSGAECRTGQHRCDGRVLQVCNEARDGWADVTECGPSAVCDATGSGGCMSIGTESRGAGPYEFP